MNPILILIACATLAVAVLHVDGVSYYCGDGNNVCAVNMTTGAYMPGYPTIITRVPLHEEVAVGDNMLFGITAFDPASTASMVFAVHKDSGAIAWQFSDPDPCVIHQAGPHMPTIAYADKTGKVIATSALQYECGTPSRPANKKCNPNAKACFKMHAFEGRTGRHVWEYIADGGTGQVTEYGTDPWWPMPTEAAQMQDY